MQTDSRNLHLLITDIDQKIVQAKNEEYSYVQKIKQKYYKQTFSQ